MTAPDPGPARHFIAGQFTDSVSGEWFDHINPATEAPTVKVAKGDSADVDAAVAAAKGVFDDGAWSRAKPSFRRKVLSKVADLIEARSDDIIALAGVGDGRSGRTRSTRARTRSPSVRRGTSGSSPRSRSWPATSRSTATTTC